MKIFTTEEKINMINLLTFKFMHNQESEENLYTRNKNLRTTVKGLDFGNFIYKTSAVFKRYYSKSSNGYRYYINKDLYNYILKNSITNGVDCQFFY